MTEIGEVREIFRSETEVRFEWRILKIFSMPEKVGSWYNSAEVQFSNSSWFLMIHPYGILPTSKEWIELAVFKSNLEKSGIFTLGIRKADGTEEKIVQEAPLPRYRNSCAVREFLQRSDLLSRKSQLAPSDVLTVTCTLRRDEPPSVEGKTLVSRETQTEDESNTGPKEAERADLDAKGKTLVSHETQTEDESNADTREAKRADLDAKGVCVLRKQLKDLLLEGDDHDVTFQIKDQEYRAHKSMLRARSSVFAAMFRHEMKELADDPIPIVDCEPEAFREFLQYVYTGKVENFSPNIAVGLYYAGDKYNVSGLKEVCIEFLNASLSTTAICDVITLAARYGEEELYDRAMAFFSEHLEEIMSTKEWRSFLAENLHQANEMCLKAVKNLKTSCIKRE